MVPCRCPASIRHPPWPGSSTAWPPLNAKRWTLWDATHCSVGPVSPLPWSRRRPRDRLSSTWFPVRQKSLWMSAPYPVRAMIAIRQALSTLAEQTARDRQYPLPGIRHRLGIERHGKLDVGVKFLPTAPVPARMRAIRLSAPPAGPVTGSQVREPELAGVPGATDGTFLWALKDIPIVTMGAGDRHVPHQVDEWVDLKQLADTARIYALTACTTFTLVERPSCRRARRSVRTYSARVRIMAPLSADSANRLYR
jgi:hypothetical protein